MQWFRSDEQEWTVKNYGGKAPFSGFFQRLLLSLKRGQTEPVRAAHQLFSSAFIMGNG